MIPSLIAGLVKRSLIILSQNTIMSIKLTLLGKHNLVVGSFILSDFLFFLV